MHGLQLVCPSTSWYVPAAHGEHSAAPSAALNEPGAHGDGAVEPVEQLLPAVQAVHSEAATRMVALEKVEAGQGSAAAAPSAQYDPAMHGLQLVCPSASWYVPAPHLVHASCCCASLYVPAAQGVAAALPTGQKVPSPHVSQSATLVITTPDFLVVPPGHGSAAAAPSAQ